MKQAKEPGIPADLSGYPDAKSSELGKLLDRVDKTIGEADLIRLVDLFSYRVMHLLRKGTRQEMDEEGTVLDRFLGSKTARALRPKNPGLFGRFDALAELLLEAARRSDPESIPTVLRSHPTHGVRLLELVAQQGPVQRSVLRGQLGIAEAQLSRLLRDFEEADLIIRFRPEGVRHVVVQLGPQGHEVVRESIRPPWIDRLGNLLEERLRGGSLSVTPEAIASELVKLGAPSRTAVSRLAEALGGNGNELDSASGDAFVKEVQAKGLPINDNRWGKAA